MNHSSLISRTISGFPRAISVVIVIALGFMCSGCKDTDKGEIDAGVCARTFARIPDRVSPTEDSTVGPFTITTTVAACTETNLETVGLVSRQACIAIRHDETCRRVECETSSRACRVDALIGTTPVVRLNSCSFDPGAGTCTCTLIVPAGNLLTCGCQCVPAT